jgi:porphobilinogen synthase
MRRLVRETTLNPADFIQPLFVRYGRDEKRPIVAMPGQFQWTVDRVGAEAREIAARGIPAVILFGIPETKDAYGSENCDPNGIVPQAIRAIKDAAPELLVISDMCFCEYTDHGHCGVVNHVEDADYNPQATRRSTPAASTGPSARRPTAHRCSATAASISWIRRTGARHCTRWRSTLPKART